MVGDAVLSPELRAAWDDDGWCVLERAIPAEDLAAAQRRLPRLFPTAEEMAATPDGDNARWHTWDAQWPEFPFHSSSLNRLAVHDVVIGLAEELLGVDDVRMYLAIITAKYYGQSSGFNQLLHADYPNHSLVVPRRDAGYQQLETFIYLSDVSSRDGATRLVSRRKTAGVPVEQHTLNLDDYAALYEDPSDAAAPAGSIVAYRPDVYHRSVDLTDPAASRFMMHVSYRPAAAEWGGYQAWPFKGFSPAWTKFVAQATPRQLGVLGFPGPGHPYWTEETLAGVAARYPGLDMTPWRRAYQSSGGGARPTPRR
jgi:hypothetical protein